MPWTGDPSIRDLILDNVVATLAGITVASGYEVDVQEVTREIRDIEEEIINEVALDRTPLHRIIAGDEQPEPIGSEGLMRSAFTVLDELVVEYGDLERAIKDTRRAMAVDRRRGTHPTTGEPLALDTRLQSVETAEGILHPFELVFIEWRIDYTYLESAP